MKLTVATAVILISFYVLGCTGHSIAPGKCWAVGEFSQRANSKEWCMNNCLNNPPYCPPSYCECVGLARSHSNSCHGVGSYAEQPSKDKWCVDNCLHNPPHCPSQFCSCDNYNPGDSTTDSSGKGEGKSLDLPLGKCYAVGEFSQREGSSKWCLNNCLNNPPYCPPSHCECVQGARLYNDSCYGVGLYAGQPSKNKWCVDNCLHYPPHCPSDLCKCDNYNPEDYTTWRGRNWNPK